MAEVNTEGLSDDQISLVNRFIALLRRARSPEAVRANLAQLWEEWARLTPNVSNAELTTLTEEAVAFARRQA